MSNYYEGGEPENAPLGRERYGEAETLHAPPHPQEQYPPPYQQYPPPAYGRGYRLGGFPRPPRQYPIETKPFFLTSEFVAYLLAVVALAITAASSEAIGAWRFWLLATALTSAYLLSRGIAKSGTRSNAPDPREQMNLNWRGGGDDHHQHR